MAHVERQKAQKQTHFVRGIAAFFMEAGGAPPPRTQRARSQQSVTVLASKPSREPRRTASLAGESERSDKLNLEEKQTHFVPLPLFAARE
jgi:hypothetical protein